MLPLIELRLALVSYQDCLTLLLTLAGAAASAARPDRRGEVRGEEGRAGGRLWLGGAFRRERRRRRSLCHVRAHFFVPGSPHVILTELRQALISHQDCRMLSFAPSRGP